ncbi:DnaJ family domain-containing protein [Planctomonas psychrotolerans]|uniref:DnaJ family domain-containing protein n=1 Tax=Planctomonas psychrotolerans TaxID=2528712 RepID=UPI00123AFB39|nr:DUF1992 domain-containing protein [Planctomonas psychrotolerans]
MASRKDPDDVRLKVARYQVDRLTGGAAENEDADTAGQPTGDQRAQYVRVAIEQAERRGDFDNLPGSGKPLANLHQAYDPDWWIRRKIEREKLTGLGPPALTLRSEDAGLNDRLDAASSERAVREILEEFNRRVVDARRQLQGGPPVITPTRDVEQAVVDWHERRQERLRLADEERERQAAELAAMTWRERRRARRRARSERES